MLVLRIFLIALFVTVSSFSNAQQSIRFQNSFFLTGQPLFGLGYQHEGNYNLSYGLNLEFGRYAHRATDLINTAQTTYSIEGLALMPEIRWFISPKDDDNRLLRGVFFAAFTHLRVMNEYIASPNARFAEQRRGHSIGGGLAAGYRTSCSDIPFYFEFLTGFGRSAASWRQAVQSTEIRSTAASYDNATTLFRLELAVGYAFN